MSRTWEEWRSTDSNCVKRARPGEKYRYLLIYPRRETGMNYRGYYSGWWGDEPLATIEETPAGQFRWAGSGTTLEKWSETFATREECRRDCLLNLRLDGTI